MIGSCCSISTVAATQTKLQHESQSNVEMACKMAKNPIDRINVWHIYLHLVDLNGKNVGNKYTSPIDPSWGFCSTSNFINFGDHVILCFCSWCHGEAGGLFACWLSIRPLHGQDLWHGSVENVGICWFKAVVTSIWAFPKLGVPPNHPF